MKELLRKLLPKSIWGLLRIAKTYYLAVKFRTIGRPYNPAETTKAKSRRTRENFFEKYCIGRGLDVGFGGDLIISNAKGYDFEHGDAQYLKNVKDDSYDFVYSSHTIEHLPDPATALKNWFRVVRRGGYLLLYLPHRDLYEKKKTLPSIFNPTHLHFFLPDRSEDPDTLGIVPLIDQTLTNYELIYCKVCDEGFTIKDPLIHSDGEYSIEVAIQKL